MRFIVTFSIQNGDNDCLVMTDEKFNILKGLKSISKRSGFCGCRVINNKIYALTWMGIHVIDVDTFEIVKQREGIGDRNHGIDYDGEYLYIVASGQGKVFKLDVDTLETIDSYEHVDDQVSNDFHINSVDVHNKMMFMTIHNHNNEGYITGRFLSIPKQEFLVTRGFTHPHHFKMMNDGWIVCNSLKGEVIYSKTPIEKSWTTTLKNYTRGLWIDKEYIYVGTSSNRSRVKDNKMDQFIDNTIYKLDRKYGKVVNEYVFSESEVGQEIFTLCSVENSCCEK